MSHDEQIDALQRAIDALPDESEAHTFSEDPAYFAEELCSQYEIENDDDARKIIATLYEAHYREVNEELNWTIEQIDDMERRSRVLRQYQRLRRIHIPLR